LPGTERHRTNPLASALGWGRASARSPARCGKAGRLWWW
jgi:hypothetical protein